MLKIFCLLLLLLSTLQYGKAMPPIEKHLLPRPLQLRKAHSDSSVLRSVNEQKALKGIEASDDAAVTMWRQSIVLYEQGSLGEAIRQLEYVHAHHTVHPLPMHYNRAVMQMALYRATKNSNYLRYAEMDFNDAMRVCRHFYPSYIGLAEVALAQRAWEKAFRILRNILDVLEVQRHDDTDVLMYDENIYNDALFVSDIRADLGLVTYCMGAAMDSDRYYAHAIEGIQSLRNVEKMMPLYRQKFKAYQQNVAGLLGSNLVLLSRPRRLIQIYDTKDVGFMRWNSLFDLPVASSHRKKPSSTLSVDVDAELREARKTRELMRMERQISSTPPIATPEPPPRSNWRATLKSFIDFDAFKSKRKH